MDAPRLLIIPTLIIVSYAISYRRSLQRVVNAINYYLFYIAIPLTVFIKVGTMGSETDFLNALIVSQLHIIAMFIISYAVARTMCKDIVDRVSLTMSIAMSNTGFLAIPLAVALFGTAFHVIPYMVAFNITLPLLTLVLAKFYATRRGNATNIYVKALPVLSALLCATVFKQLELGFHLQGILQTVDAVLSASFYLSFVIVGCMLTQLRLSDVKKSAHAIAVSMLVKYLLSPIIILVLVHTLFRYMSTDFAYMQGVLLQSLMPPAVTNIVLAKVFQLNENLVSLFILLLTPLSIVIALATLQYLVLLLPRG
uniref:AEC family transporter n=1 Tax=Ignisphaera aggregans TaxID=334771 RepID=A0A7C4FF24_9CREN